MRMESVKTLLGGYILMITLYKTNLQIIYGSCSTMVKVHNLKEIICKGDFDEVPNNLNEHVQSLLFEFSTFKKISRNSFSKYKHLLSLKLLYCTIHYVQDTKYFMIPTLTILEVQGTLLPRIQNAYFPTNLTRLKLSNCSMDDFNANDHHKLKYFNISFNKLKIIPHFNRYNSLEQIDLDFNAFIKFTVEDISSLCHLKLFRANSYGFLTTPYANEYCMCNYVKSWLDSHHIMTNIKFCTLTTDEYKPQCVETFPETWERYTECITKKPRQKRTQQRYKILILSLLTFVVITLLFNVCYYLYTRNRVVAEDANQNQTSPGPRNEDERVMKS